MKLVRKIFVKYLLVPSNWLYLFIISLLFYFDYFIASMFILFFPLVFNYIPYFLIKDLELKFPNFSKFPENRFHHIIVLGGGHEPCDNLYPEQQLNNTSLRRVLEGVRLFKANSYANLIMTGENLKKDHLSQAELQYKVAVTMGVDPSFIKTISSPRYTEEESSSYFDLYANPKIPIVLVTKAIHLRRAAKLFRKKGYEIYLAPAYFYYTDFNASFRWFFSPDFRLILVFSEYLKEIFGYLFIKMQSNYVSSIKISAKAKHNTSKMQTV